MKWLPVYSVYKLVFVMNKVLFLQVIIIADGICVTTILQEYFTTTVNTFLTQELSEANHRARWSAGEKLNISPLDIGHK